MKIADIKLMLDRAGAEDLPLLLQRFAADHRAGVRKMIESYKNRHNRDMLEAERLDKMLFFERKYSDRYAAICGVDEAGAGPLAGPVVAAAVIMPAGLTIEGINDSKKISDKKREELAGQIFEAAIAYQLAFVDNDEIDEINILQARLKAMKMAVEGLDTTPDFALVDGNARPKLEIPLVTIEKGDSKSHTIACASILAKVARDKLMEEYDAEWGEYGFARHKGYGTKEHLEALKIHGLCPIHRKTFIKS
ncbi:MAG: ribonuclease HII [Defluviitaleaceae bacterium]|nr:ribonuclease HII [Defluviitaleaceae bacterium]